MESENTEHSQIMTNSEKQKGLVAVSRRRLYIVFGFLLIIIIIVFASTVYFYKKSKSFIQNAGVSENIVDGQAQLSEALQFLDPIVVLPKNDNPVLVRIADPMQLKSDSFFDDSQIDDRVLIYPNIGRAILYRPSTKQIVNMTTFTPDSRGEGKLTASSTSKTQ